MLKDNLVMLRNLHGFSQEAIAEKIGISRQAYAKWETGATVPDIEKCLSVGERGQIVIPKGARDLFGLTGGQRMVVLSDENGIALIPEEVFMSNMKNAMERSLEKQD